MAVNRARRAGVAALCAALAMSPLGTAGQETLPAPAPLGGTAGTQVQTGAAGFMLPLPRGVDQLRSVEAPPKPSELTVPPAEPAAEPQRPTDFQLFAATSVGTLLPIFGQDLFTHPPSTFAPVQDLPASPEHLVGPGDEIVIRGWGQVDIDIRTVVSREGTIAIPRVGVVSVSGVRYRDLTDHLRRAVARFYRNFELSASLGQLRSIQVFVVGQAQRPGLYTVSSLATLLNALFAAGGPSSTGSMRKIQLRRGDKLVGELDLYDLLLQGDKSKDQRLQSGDVIFIPPVGPVAAIAGRVKTPAVYELEPGRTTLADLVRYAGGPTTTAARQSVLLERLDRKVGRVVEELPWDESSLNNRLEDGAVVTLRPISERFDNAVTLRGHVAFPVRTAWREGLRVSDLIRDRSVLVPESYWQRIASRAYPQPPPTEVPASPAEPAKTEVQSLFDEVNWDFAIVERLDRETLAPRLLPFDLGKAVIERDPADDLVLAPGDVVTVFSKRDVLPPVDRRTYFVLIEGEVVTPGIYQVAPGETLRQLVSRAGGFTDNAYLFGSEFTRRSVQAEQKERLQEIATRAEQDLETAGTEQLARAVSPEDVAATRHQLEEQRRAIARLRALKPTGRMVLAVDAKARTPEELPDLTLEDGDRLYVPMRSSVVGVYGAVYKQGNFVHEPGKPLEEYLRLAGGPTRAADKGSVYLLRADGSVISKRQSPWFADFEGTRLMPSDNIVVPQQYAPTSWVKELKDWTQILYQFGLGAAALKTLTQ